MQQSLHKAMALADAELRASEVPSLVQELARSPALVRALQVYMAIGRGRIARPYAAKRDEPVPQWLVDTVMTAPMTEPPVKQRPTLRIVGGGLVGWLKDKYRMPGWSLAAAPAAAAVLAAVSVGLLMPTSSHGQALLAAQMQRAIEKAGDTEAPALLTFRPLVSFRSKDQSYCRQYEVHGQTERIAAVACRTPAGDWQVLKQTPPFPIATLPAGSPREELDRYVKSLMDGPSLESDQVDKLRDGHWQGVPPAPAVAPNR